MGTLGIPQAYTPPPFELAQDQYAYDLWRDSDSNGDIFHNHLMNAFRVALRDELTEQQRTYVVAYYYERLTMEEIADRFSVNKSTVCRTISRAMKRLERVLRYASPLFLDKGCYMGIRKSNSRKRRIKEGI